MRIDIKGNILDNDPTEIVSSFDFWLERGSRSDATAFLTIEDNDFTLTKEEAKEMSDMLLKGIELGFFDGLEVVE